MPSCACTSFDAADPLVQQYGLGAAAIRYQAQGYHVLPLVSGGKKPHRMLPWAPDKPSGVHLASPYPEAAAYWWGLDKAANVGVATGQVSRLCVIDLDVKGGVDGRESFWRFLLDNDLGAAENVPCVQTPSGGLHLWLRTPPGRRVPERPGILPGVDIKGDGGLVVAPPSGLLVPAPNRPGEPKGGESPVSYFWASGCPCQVPEVPSWMLHWLETAISTGNTSGTNDADVPDLEAAKAHGLERGNRNSGMYKLACSLFRVRGTGMEECVKVKEELMEVWRAGDRTDFTPHEVIVIIDSARQFVADQLAIEQAQVSSYRASTGRQIQPPTERGQGLTPQQRKEMEK